MNDSAASEQLKSLNRWLIILIIFIVVWVTSIFFYVNNKSEEVKPLPPIVMIDPSSGKITNTIYTNLFPSLLVTPTNSNSSLKPIYEAKPTYEIYDFVIINYFFIEGIIVDKQGNNYTVMYKDYNKVLQKVTVPREFLLSPASQTVLNPAALLSP